MIAEANPAHDTNTRPPQPLPPKDDLSIVRRFLGAEAVAFLVASLVHRGWLVNGYTHHRAAIAETVIAIALALGFAATWAMPRRPLMPGWIAQIFALIGTCIGIFVSIRGIGPQTFADAIYHTAMLLVLIGGCVAFAKR